MTQVLEGTELAPVELPEAMTGFGLAEIAYLLSRHQTAATQRSTHLMRLDDGIELSADFLRAGASSLYARGLLTLRPDSFTTLGAAALLEYSLGSATSQTVVEVVSEASVDAAVVLIASEVLATLQPRAMGTWFTSFSGAVPDAPRLLFDVLAAATAEHPGSSVSLTTSTVDGVQGAVFARLDQDLGRWDVVDRTADTTNERRELLDEYGLRSRLAALARL